MKNLFFLFLFSFLSCGEKPEGKEDLTKSNIGFSEEKELSGSFLIQQIGEEEVSSEGINLFFDEKRKELQKNAGCNRFSASFERVGNKITVGEPTGTRMFCDGKMEREQQVMKILPQIKEVRENEDEIVFISENGEQLLTAQKNENE